MTRSLMPVLCLLVFTDTFGYAVLLPLLPFAAQRSRAPVLAIGALFASYSLCQLVAAPVLGSLSDRVGRRPILLASQAGSAIGFGLLLGGDAYWVLLLSRLIDGLTAGNISIVYAAVLDQFAPETWTRRFAYLSTATGLGILLGLIASSLVARFGLPSAAMIGLVLMMVNMALTLVVLPETRWRHPSVSPADAWRRAAVIADGAALRRTAIAVLLSTLVQSAFLLALPLYLGRVLGYGAEQATLFIAALFIVAAAYQVAGLPRLIGRIGERLGVLVGFGSVAAGGGATAFANGLFSVALSGGLLMLGIATLASTLPALLGATNRILDEGALMGLNQSVVSLGQMLGPLIGYAALLLPSTVAFGGVSVALALAGLAVTRSIRVEIRDAAAV